MISNGEGWHYLAVKKTICITKRNSSKHEGDFYCLSCLHSFRTENKLKSHKKVCKNKDEKWCKNKDFCGIVMPPQKDNLLQFNQYVKSDKMPYIIYADVESLIKKIDGCANNPKKPPTKKIGKHILWIFSVNYMGI